MADTIGTAYIQIEPSTDGLGKSLSGTLDKEASSAGASAGGKLSSALGGAAKIGMGAIAGLASAAVGAGTALYGTASATAQAGDNIDKMSQKLGVSSSFYQEWDAVLQHSGTSMDSMSATFKKLATASQNASKDQEEAFKKLGLSMKDVQNMSTEDLFASVISGLQGMDEGTERTALATQLLGKGAMEMGALLNTSAEDTQAMIDTVNELGGVMSEDAVKDSAAFQDALQDMQTAAKGLMNGAMSELLPYFTDIINGIKSLFQGDLSGANKLFISAFTNIANSIKSALPTITEALKNIIGLIVDLLPDIIEIGMSLVDALLQGIFDNLDMIIDAAIQLVTMIGQYIIENLGKLIEAGIQIIVQLADGIAKAIPELMPTLQDVMLEIVDILIENADMLIDSALVIIEALADGLITALPKMVDKLPQIILKIVEVLTNNLPKIIELAAEIIVQLAVGLIKALPELINSVPEIIDAIVKGLKACWPSIKQAGIDIVGGIWNGIKSSWEDLKRSVKNLASSLVESVKDFFKIGSPSKLFEKEVGRWIPAGISVGIDDNLDPLDKSMKNIQSELTMDDMSYSTRYAVDYNNSNDNSQIMTLLQKYLPEMANQQIVLDTGATVGALANPMNRALGKIASRGVYA